MSTCAHLNVVHITRGGQPTGATRCTACGATWGADGAREVNGL